MWLCVSTRSVVFKDTSCICHLRHQEAQLLQPEGTGPHSEVNIHLKHLLVKSGEVPLLTHPSPA